MSENKKEDDLILSTPQLKQIQLNNNIGYNCSECSSLIEILSINEDDLSMKYTCLNEKKKHTEDIEFIKTIK